MFVLDGAACILMDETLKRPAAPMSTAPARLVEEREGGREGEREIITRMMCPTTALTHTLCRRPTCTQPPIPNMIPCNSRCRSVSPSVSQSVSPSLAHTCLRSETEEEEAE